LELEELELEESVAALLENTQRCWWCSRTRVFVVVVVVVVVGAIEKDADAAKIGVFLRPRRRIDDDGADAIGSAGGDNIIIVIFGLVIVVVYVCVFPFAKDHPQKRHTGEDHEVVLVFRFFVAVAEAEKKKKTFSTTFFPASMQKWSEEKHDKKIFCPINMY